MEKDIPEDPILRRGCIAFPAVAFLVILAIVILPLAAAAPFDRDFKGTKEVQVVALIGRPEYDERRDPTVRTDTVVLGWVNWFGVKLTLHFKNEVVVRQERGSR